MGFKPSVEAKNWKSESKTLANNKSGQKSSVDNLVSAGDIFKPYFASVKAKIAKLETAQTRLVAAGKKLPKLFKSVYDQAAKVDAQADKVIALEQKIAEKQKRAQEGRQEQDREARIRHAGQPACRTGACPEADDGRIRRDPDELRNQHDRSAREHPDCPGHPGHVAGRTAGARPLSLRRTGTRSRPRSGSRQSASACRRRWRFPCSRR